MSNSTYVCFDCRTTERVPMGRITRTCRNCRKRAEHVYYKFKVPKRDDDKEWLALLRKVRPFNEAARRRMLDHLKQRKDQLDRTLKALPTAKKQKARQLETSLKLLRKQIDEWAQW